MEAEAIVSRALLIIRRARAIALRNRRSSSHLLTARRLELVRLLQQYQRVKHERVFDPLISLGVEPAQTAARSLKCECIAMGALFGAYHGRWLNMSDDDWEVYQRDMLHTSRILINHLEDEHASIERLLDSTLQARASVGA